MQILKVQGDSALVSKLATENKSEFATPGSTDGSTPAYVISFAGPDFPLQTTEKIFLKPGDYDSVLVNGHTYVVINEADVLCTIKEQ